MLCLLCPVSAAQAYTLNNLPNAGVVIDSNLTGLATLLLIVPGLLLLARRAGTRK